VRVHNPRLFGNLLSLRIRQLLLFVVIVSSVVCLCVVQLWSRLMVSPPMADVRALAEEAPIVFRGRVVKVSSSGENLRNTTLLNSIATIKIDRLYRGKASAESSLPFVFESPSGSNGHYCIDFQPYTYWLVFAVEKDGRLELFDDCDGALAISPLLGPDVKDAGWLAQMEADFLAGLSDSSSAARVLSIQRLGGLKLPSSRGALHRVIEEGNQDESKWAIYSALRTGDVTVLPKVKELLAMGDQDWPERAMSFELQNVTDITAVPNLIAILDSSPGDLTRTRVLIALGQKLRDRRAVPSLAAHLSDPDRYARYDALDGIRSISHEGACTLPPDWKEQDVEPQISRCKTWWEQVGKYQDWMQN
jgi:hypothetical protein